MAAENIAGLTVSHFGLVACQAAYNHAEPWLDELIGVLQGNLALLRDFAHATGTTLIEPEGTYLGWLDCRSLGFADADALCSFMRDKARFYLDEGQMFGTAGAGFERVNLACPKHLLERALGRMGDALAAR